MWQPEAAWRRLPGAGPGTVGVWEAWEGDRHLVVKRLAAPDPQESGERGDPGHPAYWRREVEVARSGLVDASPGLVGAAVVRVEEDETGATLVHLHVESEQLSGCFLADAMARFASVPVPPAPWLAREQFSQRIRAVERGGGWATLARTPVADLSEALWGRRAAVEERLGRIPTVLQHGDPVPSNLRGRQGGDVVAIDWSTVGVGAVGADLGYLSLSVPEDFEALHEAYVGALDLAGLGCSDDDVAFAARSTAVWTVLTRADRALAAAASGEGALAGKFRHPAVAPYLRALQRQLPHVERLLAS